MKLKPILCLLAGAMAIAPLQASAQKKSGGTVAQTLQKIENKTITGTVLDENGEPLPGATVRIEGTQQGVATDIDGNFSILNNKKDAVIIITYVGMKPYSMKLTDDAKYLQIKMEPIANMMDEVVVTGYQNIKRENATGAYQTISSEDLDKRYTGDITQNLEGKVPGLVRMEGTQNGFGEDAIRIRGTGTFEAKASPLIVVDGLPIEGGLSSVNPYDVENITVLKDAAAAAIYGARASNGVIVITTKSAKKERLTIDFNADLTISEKQNYDNYNWANAAQLIELEKYNFNGMLNDPDQTSFKDYTKWWNDGHRVDYSPISRLLMQNHLGLLSDADLNSQLDRLSKNDYYKEYQDVHDRTRITQQYNLAMRIQGRALSSSIVLNYMDDNMGVQREKSSSLQFKYKGDLKVAKWLDLSFGVNVLNNRSKTHPYTNGMQMQSFMPYQSMYNEDGSLARMELGVYPGEEAFSHPEYELKDNSFNLAEEMAYNFTKERYTNVRTHLHALVRLPVEGWTAQAQFQYEDIFRKTTTEYKNDSYYMRNLYNRFTTAQINKEWVNDPNFDWFGAMMDPNTDWSDPHLGQMQIDVLDLRHRIPDGGIYQAQTYDAAYYTFRAQTRYNREFGRHSIDAVAGFEYRQTHYSSTTNLLYGYNERTLNNNNIFTDWQFINKPSIGVLGSDYNNAGLAPKPGKNSDVLHRYYSIYFTGNYVYDSRYSISGSYRVDKTDLFGADPKFRGRPLWSVGASWNMHNEEFMRDLTYIDALKLRGSYGLTGNIDPSAKSVLTGRIGTNPLNGNKLGYLMTPPNDQLRWEKTSTWNVGVDFALWGYRLSGSLDYYYKSGSDLLTDTDLDPTTGWEVQKLNSGKMTNRGYEIQLNGHILEARRRSDLGINAYFNLAYNDNKVTKVSHKPATGIAYLNSNALHEGYPLHSLFSFDYAGLIVDDSGVTSVGWRDKDGNVKTSQITSGEFTIDDAIFSGSLDPKISGSFTPEITWNGFSLSAMFNFYTGHYMRVGNDAYMMFGNDKGYTSMGVGIPADCLKYWEGDKDALPNGYKLGNVIGAGNISYRNNSVTHADYMKVRNIVLGYSFDKKVCNKIGLNDLRLRFQLNNIATWSRSGIDPEAISPISGTTSNRAPRSYTMSLMFNL